MNKGQKTEKDDYSMEAAPESYWEENLKATEFRHHCTKGTAQTKTGTVQTKSYELSHSLRGCHSPAQQRSMTFPCAPPPWCVLPSPSITAGVIRITLFYSPQRGCSVLLITREGRFFPASPMCHSAQASDIRFRSFRYPLFATSCALLSMFC